MKPALEFVIFFLSLEFNVVETEQNRASEYRQHDDMVLRTILFDLSQAFYYNH